MCTAYTAAGDANDQHPLALPRTHPHPSCGERMSGEGEVSERVRESTRLTAEQQVVANQYDAFLPSDSLDPAWVSGWHAAINHAVYALGDYDGYLPSESWVDRDGNLWRSFSGIWYRRESSGGYGECRGTLTMLERDFGPLAPPGAPS